MTGVACAVREGVMLYHSTPNVSVREFGSFASLRQSVENAGMEADHMVYLRRQHGRIYVGTSPTKICVVDKVEESFDSPVEGVSALYYLSLNGQSGVVVAETLGFTDSDLRSLVTAIESIVRRTKTKDLYLGDRVGGAASVFISHAGRIVHLEDDGVRSVRLLGQRLLGLRGETGDLVVADVPTSSSRPGPIWRILPKGEQAAGVPTARGFGVRSWMGRPVSAGGPGVYRVPIFSSDLGTQDVVVLLTEYVVLDRQVPTLRTISPGL